MNSTARILLAATAILTAPMLTGCGKSSPTAPAAQPAGPDMRLETRVNVTRFLAVQDGDGIEGRGDFAFTASVGGHSKSWNRTLGTGESATVNWITVLDGQSGSFGVTFKATEWDTDILGRDFPDADMDNRIDQKSYPFEAGIDGTYSITLGNDACRVRMYYTIVTSMVPVTP